MTAIDVLEGRRPWSVEQGDALEWLRGLPADSVHVCVTSPPYFALRSYLPKNHPLKAKEVGSEATPKAFVETMVAVFGAVRRVTHETGVLLLNLGDSYVSGGIPSGNLIGIPWMAAFALRESGWWLRDAIVWSKMAPMPESQTGWRWQRCRVKTRSGNRASASKKLPRANGTLARNPDSTRIPERNASWSDCPGCKRCEKTGGLVLRQGRWRCTDAYEMVFLLAKSQRYFSDGEAVRTPLAEATVLRDGYSRITEDNESEQYAVRHDHETQGNASGANLRNVWHLGTAPRDVKHFALMHPEVARRSILIGTSDKGVCPACGMPWARVIGDGTPVACATNAKIVECNGASRQGTMGMMTTGQWFADKPTVGWRPTCRCEPADPIPAVVMDPFAGSGTTGLAAIRLGRRFIGCDLNPEYVALAQRRLSEDMPLFTEIV